MFSFRYLNTMSLPQESKDKEVETIARITTPKASLDIRRGGFFMVTQNLSLENNPVREDNPLTLRVNDGSRILVRK